MEKNIPVDQRLINQWKEYAVETVENFRIGMAFNYTDGCDSVPERMKYFYQRQRDELLTLKDKPLLKSIHMTPARIQANLKLDLARFRSRLDLQVNIAEAICWWKFTRRFVQTDKVLSFAESFVDHPNPYLAIAAQMETLPTKVWRDFLWYANVDFASYESFLRRLTNEQKVLLRQTHDDLYGEHPTVPEVSRPRGIRGRLKNLISSVTVSRLIKENNYATGSRYLTKGAWAYNLLNLDFGFSLYSKGKNDDTEIQNRSPFRFLSVKEHINDFIVNQETGRYWALYKSARSNYGYCPNRKVEISTHICPGFWWTLFIHLMFWVVSPILFITALKGWISTDFPLAHLIQVVKHSGKDDTLLTAPITIWIRLALVILASFPTVPVVLGMVVHGIYDLIRLFFIKLIPGTTNIIITSFEKVATVVKDWWNRDEAARVMLTKLWSIVKLSASIILVPTIALLIMVGPNYCLHFSGHLKSLGFNEVLIRSSLFILSLSLLWSAAKLYFTKLRGKELPATVKAVMATIFIFPLLEPMYIVVVDYSLTWMVSYGTYLLGLIFGVVDHVFHHLLASCWLLLGIFAVIFPISVGVLNMSDEKSFAQLDRYIQKISIWWFLITGVISIFFLGRNADPSQQSIVSMAVSLNVVGGMLVLTAYIISVFINSETITDRVVAEEVAQTYEYTWFDKTASDSIRRTKLTKSNVYQNKWLLSLGAEERIGVMNDFDDLIRRVFAYENRQMTWEVIDKLVMILSEELIEKISREEKLLTKNSPKFRKYALLRLLDNYSIRESLDQWKKLETERAARKTRRLKRVALLIRAWKVISLSVLMIASMVGLVGMLIWLGVSPVAKAVGKAIAWLSNIIWIVCKKVYFVVYMVVIRPIIWIFKTLSQLRALVILFNERCPWVTKPKVLD